MPLSPHPRRAIIAGSIVLPVCSVIMVLGAFAASVRFADEYTATYAELLDGLAGVNPAVALGSRTGLCVLASIAVSVALWIAYIRARGHRAARRGICLCTYPLLILASIPTLCVFQVLAAPLITLYALFLHGHRHVDVEFVGSGLYAWAALGLWLWTLLGLLILDSIRPNPPAHTCPECAYDRTGLAAGGPCPECGRAPAGRLPAPSEAPANR